MTRDPWLSWLFFDEIPIFQGLAGADRKGKRSNKSTNSLTGEGVGS